MTVAEYLSWQIKYRTKLKPKIKGFSASIFSYADGVSQFSEYCALHNFSRTFKSRLGRLTYSHGLIINAEIGSFCSIGKAVIGGQGRHPTEFLSTHPSLYTNGAGANISLYQSPSVCTDPRKVNIDHDVWIGDGAVIMEGRHVGTGAVVGANAVVTKDVPPYAIVAGVPAKILRFRFQSEEVEELLKSKWWEWSLDKIGNAAALFDKTGIEAVLNIK